MPYNPGIQDRSGEILAQGIGNLGNSIQQGMMSYAQNKTMAAQALGKFEGALRANPDLLQFLNPDQPSPNAPSDAVKAFMKLQKDGTLGVKDAALLSTFADSYTKAKEDKQAATMRDQQMQQNQLLMARQQQEQASEDAMNQRMQQMAQLGRQQERGVGGGVLRPEISQQAREFMQTSAGQLASQGVRLNPAQMVGLQQADTTRAGAAERAQMAAESRLAQQGLRNELGAQTAAAKAEAATAKAEAEALKTGKKDSAQVFEETKKLRDEFGAKDSAKNFAIVSTAYNLAKDLAARGTPADDMAFVYSVMKAYDPRSTVREGERADAKNTGSIPERVWQAYNKAAEGNDLSPKMRADFLKTLDDAAKNHYDNMMRDAKHLQAIAKKRGLDPDEVVPTEYISWTATPAKATPAAPAAPIKIISIKKVQ